MAGPDRLEELRRTGFAIAYRMLGSVADAEDVVQEGLLRLHCTSEGGEQIASPQAYLATVVTRLAIDHLRSARVQRESYVGEWLPEPLLSDPEDDPARRAEMADSLSTAFLVLLESLSPDQRAAFLLHDVFDYSYGQIAEIVGVSEDNARQLASRARRHVEEGKPRFDTSREQGVELARRFIAASREGDLEGLEALLAEDVAVHGDGGGKAPAIARPLYGRTRVARTLVAWFKAGLRIPGLTVAAAEVNGQPGIVSRDGEGRWINVMTLDVAGGRIEGVHSVVNPDKLRHLGPVADVNALLRGPDRPS
jgi:RNA polymerase sigma-70 factor (TIGR02957 family)